YNVRNCIDLPQASAEVDTELNCENLEVSFQNNSINAPNFRWYFDTEGNSFGELGSTEVNPTFEYENPGFYTVALVALFDTTCADTSYLDLGVFESQLEADFNLEVNSCTEEIELRFSDISTDPDFVPSAWEWEFIGTFDTLQSEMQNPVFMVDSSQTFDVRLLVTSANGCTDLIERSVDVNLINVDLVGIDTTICLGDEIRLVNNPIQGFSYSWTPTIGLSNPSSANPLASPEDSTTYTVVISDGLCTISKSIDVNIAPPIPIENPGSFIVCIGDTIAIPIVNLDPENRFFFQPNEVIVGPNTVNNPLVTSSIPQDVRLPFVGVDGFGCSTRDTILVSFQGITSFALQDSTITCGGQSAELNPDPNESFTYQWEPAAFLDD
ncbi:MAG: hypothetical protein AAGK97_16855, partial [Bacteroidota bacterium]